MCQISYPLQTPQKWPHPLSLKALLLMLLYLLNHWSYRFFEMLKMFRRANLGGQKESKISLTFHEKMSAAFCNTTYCIYRGQIKGCNSSITAIMCQVGYLICITCLVTYTLCYWPTIVRSLDQCILLLVFYNY